MMEFLCTLPLLASLFTACDAPPPLAVGYVEGEYVLVAPIETARILSVNVKRGDRIAANQPLVAMERRDAEIAVAQAKAALAQAISYLGNLRQGKRPEEIAVVAAELGSAKAQAAEARRVLLRKKDLLKRKTVSQASFDAAATELLRAEALVEELRAGLAVAKLPGRPDEIKAAEAAVDQMRQAVRAAQWRLENRTLSSPEPGRVFDIIRNPGEVAGPQAPILSMLPDGAVKLRLYVSEAGLQSVMPGRRLDVHCDGCGAGMTATVTYVATDPEFTPPVIYSLENRQKLVYLIEAKPDPAAQALKPGQIVDVALHGDAR